MFSLDRVTVNFQNVAALKSVSLEIPESSTTVLLGTSGSGKSTILRVLLGLVSPSQGEVLYRASRLRDLDLLKARQEIGFMTQEGGLFPHLTIRENIQLVPECIGWTRQQTGERVHQLLSMAQLDSALLENYPHQVSGGQRQRAVLIRSLMLDPPVILLDEPLGALDPITRFDLQKDLRTIFKKLRKTVLLVTHDLHEAKFFADRIHILHNGELIQSGSFRQILRKPANDFVIRFFSAQNFTAHSS